MNLASEVKSWSLAALAFAWRRLLRGTTFIAVSGSDGKTTATELTAAILATRSPTVKTRLGLNNVRGICGTILHASPWTRYVVVEVGISLKGQMRWYARLLRPDIVLLLGVGREHEETIGPPAAIAAEKAELVKGVRRGGLVILNADNRWSAALRPPAGSRVSYFGSRDDCVIRTEVLEARWPRRLDLRVHDGPRFAVIRSQFVGEHWAQSIGGAVAVARACGVDLDECAAIVARQRPFTARLEPLTLPNGAVLLRDDGHGTALSFQAALKMLSEARGVRRVIVTADCNSCIEDPGERRAYLGRLIADSADLAVFVGAYADVAARAAREAGIADAIHLDTLDEGVRYIAENFGAADLILLKARKGSKLVRLLYGQYGDFDCHLEHCLKASSCRGCPELKFRPFSELPEALRNPSLT